MKVRYKRILGCFIVCLLTAALLVAVSFLTERKDSRSKYGDFYSDPKDYDVLFFGTSHVINGIFPLEMWKQTGITSFNLAGHSCPLATSYHLMMNAFKVCEPEVVVIDAYNIDVDYKTSVDSFSYLHMSMDAIPFSSTKLAAVRDLLDDPNGDALRAEKEIEGEAPSLMGLIWPFTVYHNRWNELTKYDLYVPFDYYMGAEYRSAMSIPNRPVNAKDEVYEGDTISVEYLKKMVMECRDRNIKVLITVLPYPNNKNGGTVANRVELIADELGVDCINFLKLDVVNTDTDYYDNNHHLNTSGGRKVTEYIGSYLAEHYGLKGHSDDTYWNDAYQEYVDREIPLYKYKSTKFLFATDFLSTFTDPNHDVEIEMKGINVSELPMLAMAFENLGAAAEEIDKAGGAVRVNAGGDEVDYYAAPELEFEKCFCFKIYDRRNGELVDEVICPVTQKKYRGQQVLVLDSIIRDGVDVKVQSE